MSIIRLNPNNFEKFSVIARPRRTFTSSSAGVTGSVPVFARSSAIEKDVDKSVFNDAPASFDDPESIRAGMLNSSATGGSNLIVGMQNYLAAVNSLTRSPAKDKRVESIRFETPFTAVSTDLLRKNNIRTVLFPYYRVRNPYTHWAFTNYQCLNFFTGSGIPTNTVLAYNNEVPTGSIRGPYTPPSDFTLECYVNPRYQNESAAQPYYPGTIYHLSSTFALSLCSGSSTDANGLADKFRLMLQLSASAEVDPNKAVAGNYTFFSDDNSLSLNHWHHVAVRWSPNYDNGTGSFVIDGVERGYFYASGSTISPVFETTPNDQDVLFVGNYYSGPNTGAGGTLNFNHDPSQLNQFYNLSFPLRAELHELRIWSEYLDDDRMSAYRATGLSAPLPLSLLFYVPVLFTKDSPTRQVFVTPFQKTTQQTQDAHNISMSFGVGGHEVNVENFVKDFVQGGFPTLFNLTGSEITSDITSFEEANTLLYASETFRKRNLTVLPCDNGLMKPDYTLLATSSFTLKPSESSYLSKYVNDFNTLDLSLVTLNNLLSTASLYPGLIPSTDGLPSDISRTIEGAGPDNLNSSAQTGNVLTIFQRQRDNTSNSVTFFDTSNLFYGGRIHPTSLEIIDSAMTGSGGVVRMTLRDNGRGGLHRADALTPHPKWAGVGTVLYDEGIAILKSPLIYLFGRDQFEISMRGERPVHVMEIAVPCPAGQINSSSNPTFMPLTASDDPTEAAVGPVIITGINLHDDNLNVVARVSLAQPIIKRSEDRFLFRIKMDW